MTPDHQRADAAAATAVAHMQDTVIQKAHDLDVAPGQKALTKGIATAEPEITRRDVHTASSINAQRGYSRANPKETNLAHQAAIRRSVVKGKDSAEISPLESSSAASSKPVLVRALSTQVDMKKKTRSRVYADSPKLPPLESFSIQDILTSIGPEANASIDAIAEICGRSKMSLAEEHSSHRPPHVQLQPTDSSPAEFIPSVRLDPVVEVNSIGPHTRSKARLLKLANAFYDGEMVSGDATTAISNVTSQVQAKGTKYRRDDTSTDPAPALLLSQVLAWLRRSPPGNEAADVTDRDTRVKNTLRSMLSDSDSMRP